MGSANDNDGGGDDFEAEAEALLEKNKEKLRRLRKEFEEAEEGAEEPEGSIMLGPKDELSYRRMKRELDEQADDEG